MIKRFLYWMIAKFEGYDPRVRIHNLQSSLNSAMEIPASVSRLIPMALLLCKQHDGKESGEWRRHQVLSSMIKRGANERDAALAIEKAVRILWPI